MHQTAGCNFQKHEWGAPPPKDQSKVLLGATHGATLGLLPSVPSRALRLLCAFLLAMSLVAVVPAQVAFADPITPSSEITPTDSIIPSNEITPADWVATLDQTLQTEDETEPYMVIRSSADLWYFAQQVNDVVTNANYLGKLIVLDADIDLQTGYNAGKAWNPIGANKPGNRYFEGVFDGQGHTISGLNSIDLTQSSIAGLFGTIRDATIKNLIVQGTYTTTTTAAAGVVGQALITTNQTPPRSNLIENVGNEVNVTNTHTGRTPDFFYDGVRTAGILAVTSSSSSPIPTVVINRCYNAGAIQANDGVEGARPATAGIIAGSGASSGLDAGGSPQANQGATKITSCYNLGDISGSYFTGGIAAGYQTSFYDHSPGSNSNTWYYEIQNCYNAGIVARGDGLDELVGAISGITADKLYTNNYYLDTSSTKGVGTIASEPQNVEDTVNNHSKKQAELQDPTLIGVGGLPNADYREGNGYPVLAWQEEVAAAPIITTQPVASWADQNATATAFTVEAKLPAGSKESAVNGQLTRVEWFSNNTATTTGATSVQTDNISDSTVSSSFTPPTTTQGQKFYYAVITNTWTGSQSGSQTVTSDFVSFKTTNPNIVAASPVIISQPQPTVLQQASSGASLSVQVDTTDTNSTFGYQWFVNTAPSNTGGTVVLGAKSPTVAINTTNIGDYFYYCQVARTVEGVKSVTVNSQPTQVHIKGIEIYTPQDLYKIQVACNGSDGSDKKTYAGLNIELMNDIDLSKAASTSEWVAIANTSSNTSFQGTFDGHGYTISGLSVTKAAEMVGLFGRVFQNGTIKNLTVKGSINISGSASYVGGIVGSLANSNASYSAQIINCGSEVDITLNSTNTGNAVGGIVSSINAQYNKITGSYYKGNIVSTVNAGGISGGNFGGFGNYASGSITFIQGLSYARVAGLAAFVSESNTISKQYTNNYSAMTIKGQIGIQNNSPIDIWDVNPAVNFSGIQANSASAAVNAGERNYWLEGSLGTLPEPSPDGFVPAPDSTRSADYMKSDAFVSDLNASLLQPYFVAVEGAYPRLYWEGVSYSPDTAAAESALQEASAVQQSVTAADNGNNVGVEDYWVPTAVATALAQAVNNANATLANPYSTQSQIDTAKQAVIDATTAYEAAKQRGSRHDTWVRLSGGGRYQTMQDIILGSGAFTAVDTDTVIVATGTNFPDALAASGLAGIKSAPVVLSAPDALSTEAEDTIAVLAPEYIYVVGGTGAVSDAVLNRLKVIAPDPSNVKRLSGSGREQTALDIYREGLGSWGSTAIIADGKGYADALAIAPYAYAERAPLFLSDRATGLSSQTRQDLAAALTNGSITHIVIVGGTTVVPDIVKEQLGYSAADETIFTRLGGAHRYETSVKIAIWSELNSQTLGFNKVAVATGEDFPDALAGGAFAGKTGTVLVLTHHTALGGSFAIDGLVKQYQDRVGLGHILGGEDVVPDSVKQAFEDAAAGR